MATCKTESIWIALGVVLWIASMLFAATVTWVMAVVIALVGAVAFGLSRVVAKAKIFRDTVCNVLVKD